jgi:polyphosphate:AMP phosphotransferase
MFESAELGCKVSKEEYDRRAPKIRAALLRLQGELGDANFPVLVVVAGVEGGGKTETVNMLVQWMDARSIETHAFPEPSQEERERPPFWRYWMRLPPKGKIGVLLGAWYNDTITDAVYNGRSLAELDQQLERIAEFEQMLADDGALIVKFWLHLSRPAQKARLETLEKDKMTRWQVTKQDWKYFKRYDEFRSLAERMLRKTNSAEARWHVIDASDERHRTLAVTGALQQAIEERLKAAQARARQKTPRPELPEPPPVNVINQLDLTLSLPDAEYETELLKQQGRLNRLSRKLRDKGRSLIVVFEGPDAAGKGGAIRRMAAAMDARCYRIITIGAPTEEERAQPYLWRFWRHLPRQGRVTVYDRSWYGRVLVERLEGFAEPEEWERAYNEIEAFEEQLVGAGIVLAKFWLAVSEDEQLARFKDREATAYKQYKITEEDWRNRKKWAAYEAAACDMIERTSTEIAPWTLVEANDKKWARIKVLKTICDRLEAALKGG